VRKSLAGKTGVTEGVQIRLHQVGGLMTRYWGEGGNRTPGKKKGELWGRKEVFKQTQVSSIPLILVEKRTTVKTRCARERKGGGGGGRRRYGMDPFDWRNGLVGVSQIAGGQLGDTQSK